jgi:hypothetical protein
MKQNSFSQNSMFIFSIGLLVVTIAVFAWIWFGTSRPSADAFRISEDLAPVSVAGLESNAKTLLDGLKNNSGIPIPEPIGKEGRADPFASL